MDRDRRERPSPELYPHILSGQAAAQVTHEY